MRTIKFRAKNRLNQWVYGVPCVYPEMKTDACMFNSYWTDDNGCLHETRFAIDDTNTVGQFTGLCDKNGKEIYEGDILRYPPKDQREENNFVSYEVFWHDNDCADRHIGWQMNRRHFHGNNCGVINDFTNFLPKYTNKMEVIGNVVDNPELLKGGK